MLQNFLNGKKKYSALILTLLAAILPILITNAETQNQISTWLPSIAAVISGIVYIITQGSIDKAKTQAEGQLSIVQAQVTNGTITLPAAQPAQPVAPASQPAVLETAGILDLKLFHERVLSDTATKYKEVNPATVFYEARDKGSITTAKNIQQVMDYWDYLITLAYPMVEDIKERSEALVAGPCKGIASPELVLAQQDLSKTLKFRDNVYALAKTNIDWRTRLAPNDTLYHVGIWAEYLLT